MQIRTFLAAVLTALMVLVAGTYTAVGAQELPPPKPITLACAVNASSQVLGATPVGDGSQTLVLVRVIFGPGGSIGAHTHPGTLTVTVESGTLGFTLLDQGPMSITRAATADTEATQENVMPGGETVLNPGDGFIEMGMVHSASNLSDGDTTVLFAGLVETGQPVTACAESTLSSSHTMMVNP